MRTKTARKKELTHDMLTPTYLSRTQELIDKFGYVVPGMLERRFNVQPFYAELLIEYIRERDCPASEMQNSMVKTAEQIAKEAYVARNPQVSMF